MKQRMGRHDMIFLAAALAAAFIVWLFFALRQRMPGADVVVTVDGRIYGTYPLSQNQEIPIIIDGKTTNYLVIKDNKADMTKADCPDRLCVQQKPIAKTNETIVCLPNKVVVSVAGNAESGLDSIAK